MRFFHPFIVSNYHQIYILSPFGHLIKLQNCLYTFNLQTIYSTFFITVTHILIIIFYCSVLNHSPKVRSFWRNIMIIDLSSVFQFSQNRSIPIRQSYYCHPSTEIINIYFKHFLKDLKRNRNFWIKILRFHPLFTYFPRIRIILNLSKNFFWLELH
jgi:hypothetical protein